MCYFRGELPHNYRRRRRVSLLSSKRDQVVPRRYRHQANFVNFNVKKFFMSCYIILQILSNLTNS